MKRKESGKANYGLERSDDPVGRMDSAGARLSDCTGPYQRSGEAEKNVLFDDSKNEIVEIPKKGHGRALKSSKTRGKEDAEKVVAMVKSEAGDPRQEGHEPTTPSRSEDVKTVVVGAVLR